MNQTKQHKNTKKQAKKSNSETVKKEAHLKKENDESSPKGKKTKTTKTAKKYIRKKRRTKQKKSI